MSKKIAFRTAKLSSESKKIKNTSNVGIAYEYQPKDIDERRHGVLFGVIDIVGVAKQSEELIDIILETFHGEYYQNIEKDPLESFENALSKINEELGEYTNDGNTSWMGKLNAVLGVLNKNTIHVTQTGKAEGYLYRGGKESNITEDLAGDKINPLRTFVNITSGEIIEGDKISMLSSGIVSLSTPDELKTNITKHQPKAAIGAIADIIEGTGGLKGHNAAIIIEFLSPDALASDTLDSEPDEIWLKGTSKREIMAEHGTNVFKKMLGYLKIFAIQLGIFYAKYIVPYTKKGIKYGKNKYSEYFGREKKDSVIIDTNEEIEDFERESIFEKEGERTVEQPSHKSEIRIKESDESPGKAKIERTKNSVLSNLGSFYGSATSLAKRHRPKKIPKLKKVKGTYLLIATLAVVIIIVPYLLIVRNNQAETARKEEEKVKYEQVVSDISEANSIGDDEALKAIAILEDAKKSAEELSNGKYYGNEAREKVTEIDALINTMTITTHVTADTLADISDLTGSEIAGIYDIDGTLYAITVSGDIISIIKDTGKKEKLELNGDKIEGTIISAAPLERIRSIGILTDSPAVYELDIDDNSVAKKDATNDWEPAVSIDSFGTNLYLLSQDDSQVFKHIRTSSGYGSGNEYLDDTSSIQSPQSFTIDSDIYILAPNGDITKYTAGEKQAFDISGLLVDIGEAKKIKTTDNTSNLYVSSNNYIVVIGKDGKYKKRYISDSFSDIKTISIDGDTLYVALGNKILSFDAK